MKFLHFAFAAIAMACAAALAHADPPHYTITVLSPPGNTGDTQAIGINNLGEVSGGARSGFIYHNGVYTDVPPSPGNERLGPAKSL